MPVSDGSIHLDGMDLVKVAGYHRAKLGIGYMPEVAEMAKRRASTLSGGQQKMVALARAIMSGRKLLLLDEPFEGLSPAMGDKFANAILDIQTGDLAILVAESDVKRLNFVKKVYTIERGEIVPDTAN